MKQCNNSVFRHVAVDQTCKVWALTALLSQAGIQCLTGGRPFLPVPAGCCLVTGRPASHRNQGLLSCHLGWLPEEVMLGPPALLAWQPSCSFTRNDRSLVCSSYHKRPVTHTALPPPPAPCSCWHLHGVCCDLVLCGAVWAAPTQAGSVCGPGGRGVQTRRGEIAIGTKLVIECRVCKRDLCCCNTFGGSQPQGKETTPESNLYDQVTALPLLFCPALTHCRPRYRTAPPTGTWAARAAMMKQHSKRCSTH